MNRIINVITSTLIITGIIASLFYYFGTKYEDEIYLYYRDHILKVKDDIKIEKNQYYNDKNYAYVQNTDDFVVKSKKHLLNVFYTIINSGTDNFTFYCDDSYTECKNDIIALSEDKDTLSNINNFVHPFNSFRNVKTSFDKYGEVNLEVNKLYTNEDINIINKKVDEIISKEIKNKMNNKQKIEIIHNYIINHGRYATDTVREKNPNKSYNKANDILIEGYGLCSAYADAMAIFLNRLGIDNYKIANSIHVWNLVNVDKKWLHLDLTWDDPITSNGKDKLETIFLLIDNKRLAQLKIDKHNYDKNVYKEAA